MKRVILIGAGDRGIIYASHALKHPDKLKIVAVAEPVRERREAAARAHGIPGDSCFSSWEDLLKKDIPADGCIIATQDTMHVEPAVMALTKGCHVLLEKPMALTEKECQTIVRAADQSGMTLNVCHVLRYTDFFKAVKEVIDSGELGEVHTIYHAENVSYYHMAHSYVRGNWRRSDEASPMILAKSCHDMDLIGWFAGSDPVRVSSFGHLSHFTSRNAPEGAPKRCTDGCPAAGECLYEAVSTYLRGRHLKLALTKTSSAAIAGIARFMLRFPFVTSKLPLLSRYHTWGEWPTSTITEDLSEEGILRALREGPYGRCVYACDNDQVDHQETIIEFAKGTTAVLKMHGHSHEEGRTLRIDGSRGTLRGKFGGGGSLEVHDHATGKKRKIKIKTDLVGHSEGDRGIMENFIRVLEGGMGLTDAEESLMSHHLAFAAHSSRISGKVVKL